MGFMFACLTSSLLAQEIRPDGLQNTKFTMKMDRQPIGLVFRELMERYDLLIGFEESILDRDHSDYNFDTNSPSTAARPLISADGKVPATLTASKSFKGKHRLITLNCENAPLQDVLDTIVGQMQNYTWEIQDGVVNIFPNRGRSDKFEQLLRTRVASFAVKKGQPVRAITEAIIDLPEFQDFLKENRFYFTGLRGGSDVLVRAQYGRPIPEDIRLSDVTFRELLNLTTKAKRGGWAIRMAPTTPLEFQQIDIDI